MATSSVPLPDLQVGDRVVYMSSSSRYNLEATVVVIPTTGDIGIAFDRAVGYHNCEGHCENGHGWWTAACNLRLLVRNEQHKKYHIVSSHVNPGVQRRLTNHGKQAR